MSGKALLILLLGTMAIALVSFTNMFETTSRSDSDMTEYFLQQQAHNISQTGINLAVRQMANDLDWRTGISLSNIFNGQLTVTLVDTVFSAYPDSVVKIESIAVMIMGSNEGDTITATSIAFVDPKVTGGGFIPAAVLAAITTNNDVGTLGNLTVDGRDHDINGNLIPNHGTQAIWTTQNLSRGGNSKLASTAGGFDFAPQKTENDFLRLEGQTYPGGGYPSTPDSILGGTANGFSNGTLKSLAMAGAGGSQYTTDPSTLTYPLTGITYVELASGDTWSPANIDGSGILIVHNTATDAAIKNINTGTFTGMIIADDIVHIHVDIIGAVVGLSPTPSEGNSIGNGTGNVLYSEEAIKSSTNDYGGEQDSTNTLFGNVIAWWD